MFNKRRERSTFHQLWQFSQAGSKRENLVMTTNTITARRKGDPHHMLRGKLIVNHACPEPPPLPTPQPPHKILTETVSGMGCV